MQSLCLASQVRISLRGDVYLGGVCIAFCSLSKCHTSRIAILLTRAVITSTKYPSSRIEASETSGLNYSIACVSTCHSGLSIDGSIHGNRRKFVSCPCICDRKQGGFTATYCVLFYPNTLFCCCLPSPLNQGTPMR